MVSTIPLLVRKICPMCEEMCDIPHNREICRKCLDSCEDNEVTNFCPDCNWVSGKDSVCTHK